MHPAHLLDLLWKCLRAPTIRNQALALRRLAGDDFHFVVVQVDHTLIKYNNLTISGCLPLPSD